MLINNGFCVLIILFPIVIQGTSTLPYNQPKFCPLPTWESNAITFAGVFIVGTKPTSVFVNSNNIVHTIHLILGQLLRRSSDGTYPIEEIQYNGRITPLSHNTLFATNDDDIYVSIEELSLFSPPPHPHLVRKWTPKKDKFNLLMNADSPCFGLFVDINNTIYCSMHNPHKVVKKWLDDGGFESTNFVGADHLGSNSNELHDPSGIFVDTNFDLYVADSGNNRIQLFRSGHSQATTVAGYKSPTNTITLAYPTAVVLDADKYLFIVDQGNNRIVGSGPNGLRCLVGCSGLSGFASDRLSRPQSLSFDSLGNMFVADTQNNRIQKFLLSTNSCIDQSTTSESTSTVTTTKTTSAHATESTTASTTLTGTTITHAITSTTRKTKTTQIETVLSTIVTTTTTNKPPSNTFQPKACNVSTLMGPNCDLPSTKCAMLQPCQNNGTCKDDASKPDGYYCVCPSDFDGIRCQSSKRSCEPNPCFHDGMCNDTSNGTFDCLCPIGWHGDYCEKMDNYCDDNKCENNGVCRPLFRGHRCECLGNSFSGERCEIVADKIQVYRMVSKSFAYIAIIALAIVAMFIVIMNILKYCFGIDPVETERERIRRKRPVKKRKPVIQRFAYVHA